MHLLLFGNLVCLVGFRCLSGFVLILLYSFSGFAFGRFGFDVSGVV